MFRRRKHVLRAIERDAFAGGLAKQIFDDVGDGHAILAAKDPHAGAKRFEVRVVRRYFRALRSRLPVQPREQFGLRALIEKRICFVLVQHGKAGREAGVERALAEEACAERVDRADRRGG